MPRLLLPLSAIAMGLTFAPPLQAISSTPILVTASRFQTSINSASVNSTIITAAQIKASNVTTLSQLLELQGGVQVTNLFGITGTKSSADLGGFGATANQNTLILLNGRRLNDIDLSGANLATIPLNSIARIEIIHGSSAVLYGDNATAGVINIVTKNGFEQPRTQFNAGVGSFNTQQLDLGYGRPTGSDSAIFIGASGLRSDGYRDQSDFTQQSLNAELSRTTDDFNYGFRFNGNYEDQTLPGALDEQTYQNNPRAATTTNEWASQNRNALEAYLDADLYAIELTTSHKFQEANLFGKTETDLSSWSATPRLTLSGGGHDVITGLDVYYSALDSRADFGAPNTNTSATTRTSYALYISDSYSLGRRSSISAGLRRQWADVGIDNNNLTTLDTTNNSRRDNVSAWDIGLSHQFNKEISGYIRWADSFRFAVLDEMWSYFDGTSTLLKPQTGHHIEAGTRIVVTKKDHFDVNLFEMALNQEIGFDSVNYKNINFTDPTRHRGLNLNLRHQVNDLWLTTLGYGWRAATFSAGNNAGKTIPEVPKHKLSLGNSFEIGYHSQLNVDLVYTGRRYFGNDFDNAAKQMPSHTRINLGYSYTLKSWTARFSINNLTDKKTADSGYYSAFNDSYSYYPLPGRAFYLTLSTEFYNGR